MVDLIMKIYYNKIMNQNIILEMNYRYIEYGFIGFEIKSMNKEIFLEFKHKNDNFDEFIIWMESILKGKNGVFEHCADFTPFYFEYSNDTFYVYEFERDNIDTIKVNISREILIKELYYKLMDFIKYKYIYYFWENVTFGIYLEKKYNDINIALKLLKEKNHKQIIDLLNNALLECKEEPYYNYSDFTELEYINGKEKNDYLLELLNEGINNYWGNNLYKIKSKYIEDTYKNNN
jgi:hypothetical protein